jgi:osmotically-inducible protein OsmY
MDRYRDRSVTERGREEGRRDETSQYPRERHEGRSWGEDFDREGYTRERGGGRGTFDEARDAWRGREPHRGEPDWDRDRYPRSGGYGQGSAGGFNEQHESDFRSGHGEDRWRPGREFGNEPRGRSDWRGGESRGREQWARGGEDWGRAEPSRGGDWDRSDWGRGTEWNRSEYGGTMSGGRGGWTGSQYDRGGWGSENPTQRYGGGTTSSGSGYGTEGGFDRGQGREYGRGSRGEARDEWSRGHGGQQHSGTYGGYGSATSTVHEQGRRTQGNLGGVGTREWSRDYEQEGREARGWTQSYDRDRDWNQDTRDRGEGGGIMESIGRFFGFGPKNYKRSDERITEEVNDRLYRHPDIDASDIDVSVKEGEVTLSGTVDSRRAKYMAEEVCEQVMGVGDVNNQLRVRKQQPSAMTTGTYTSGGRGMGGSTLGTSSDASLGTTSTPMGTTASSATTGTGTTSGSASTLGQSQTGTTRDVGETSRDRNKK